MGDAGKTARRFSLDRVEVADLLLDFEAYGWVYRVEFAGAGGWTLTEGGRMENERQLADELEQSGSAAAVAHAHTTFLPLNARFARRYLDISPHALPDVQRRLAQLWLLDLATAALRVRLRKPALASERAFREAFAELANADLALSLPLNAAGALFSLGVEDEQALVGRLGALTRAEQLVEAHDEDWFRNPRAIEQLRAEASLPPVVQADPERTQRSLALTQKRLEQLLR